MVIYDLGKITDWITSIGTVGAVIVALYLANRERKPKAKVKAMIGHLVYGPHISDEPNFISIEIVNTGLIPIHLLECSIQMSRHGNERMLFTDGSHNVDKLLNPGEFYKHNLDYQVIKNSLLNRGIKHLKTYCYFQDASGKKYKANIRLNFN